MKRWWRRFDWSDHLSRHDAKWAAFQVNLKTLSDLFRSTSDGVMREHARAAFALTMDEMRMWLDMERKLLRKDGGDDGEQ